MSGEDVWHPDLEDILIVHDQISIVSEVRTSGFRLSRERGKRTLEEVIEGAKEKEGIYLQAAVYLKSIIVQQPFNDGNHRTAYLIASEFITRNGKEFSPEQRLSQDEIVTYLKSEVGFNELQEIASWLEGDA